MNNTVVKLSVPIAGLAIALCALAVRRPLLYLNWTASMPQGVYLVRGREPHPGDDVLLSSHLIRSFGLQLPALLLKQYAYAAGEQITIDRHGLFVNGVLIARRVVSFGVSYDAALPRGFAVVLGENPRSYDSRYFGPVPVSDLTPVVPLLTWGAK